MDRLTMTKDYLPQTSSTIMVREEGGQGTAETPSYVNVRAFCKMAGDKTDLLREQHGRHRRADIQEK